MKPRTPSGRVLRSPRKYGTGREVGAFGIGRPQTTVTGNGHVALTNSGARVVQRVLRGVLIYQPDRPGPSLLVVLDRHERLVPPLPWLIEAITPRTRVSPTDRSATRVIHAPTQPAAGPDPMQPNYAA